MTDKQIKIAIAEVHGWQGKPVQQSWLCKKGYPKYWRSLPLDDSGVYDDFPASQIARVLLTPEGKPVLQQLECGTMNNQPSYFLSPVVEYFDNKDQYKPWPVVKPSLLPFVKYLPDYLNDLDAIHEVEKLLLDDQYWPHFYDNLARVTGGDYNMRAMISATARHRAEALLRTLNLWK